MDLCACIQVYVFACIGPRVFAPIWEGCTWETAKSSFISASCLTVEPQGVRLGFHFAFEKTKSGPPRVSRKRPVRTPRVCFPECLTVWDLWFWFRPAGVQLSEDEHLQTVTSGRCQILTFQGFRKFP